MSGRIRRMIAREVETLLRNHGFQLFRRKVAIANGGILKRTCKRLCRSTPIARCRLERCVVSSKPQRFLTRSGTMNNDEHRTAGQTYELAANTHFLHR